MKGGDAPAKGPASELRLPELNRILLSGRLTRDPDRRYASDGTAVTSLSLAFHRHYRSRDGKLAEHTGYVTVMTYQRLAEVCGQYLHTGSGVVVEGRLQMREWTNARGEKQHVLEVRADSVHFLDKAPGAPDDSSAGGAATPETGPGEDPSL